MSGCLIKPHLDSLYWFDVLISLTRELACFAKQMMGLKRAGQVCIQLEDHELDQVRTPGICLDTHELKQ